MKNRVISSSTIFSYFFSRSLSVSWYEIKKKLGVIDLLRPLHKHAQKDARQEGQTSLNWVENVVLPWLLAFTVISYSPDVDHLWDADWLVVVVSHSVASLFSPQFKQYLQFHICSSYKFEFLIFVFPFLSPQKQLKEHLFSTHTQVLHIQL